MRILALVSLLLTLAADRVWALDSSPQGLYAQMLNTYTRPTDDLAGTRVDYAGLARDPRWRETLAQLEATSPAERSTRAQKLAFWINAYNIFAIELVVRNLPVASIRDIGSLFRPVWKRQVGAVSGKPVTLDEIEHKILRPMGDPRIHAAIVCASLSCPSLRRAPYTPEHIDKQLDAATSAFLANRKKGLSVDRRKNQLTVSKIFDWFEQDFEKSGGVRKFVTAFAPPGAKTWLKGDGADARIRYFDYDWQLNSVATSPGDQ